MSAALFQKTRETRARCRQHIRRAATAEDKPDQRKGKKFSDCPSSWHKLQIPTTPA